MIDLNQHGYDLADEITRLSIKNQKQLFKTIDIDRAAEFFPYIDDAYQVQIFLRFPVSKQKALISMMASDDVIDLLRLLPSPLKNKLLNENEDKIIMTSILELDEDSIGAHVSIDFCEADIALTAKEVTKKLILEAPDLDIVDRVFIHDHHIFKGVIDLKTLLKTEANINMQDALHPYVSCHEDTPIDEAIHILKTTNQKVLPIVNDEDHLLGVITLDDALDLLEEAAIEDYEKMIAAKVNLNGSFYQAAFQRLPWLVMLLVMFIPMMLLSHQFEALLEKIVVLMLFQPLILGTAGNVATQTLALTLQSLSKKQGMYKKTLVKELMTSIMISISMGILALLLAYLYATLRGFSDPTPLVFSLVIGLSLASTLFFAPLIAITIPSLLQLLKVDPAIASGPFITTFIDVSALLIYFSIATLLLGGL